MDDNDFPEEHWDTSSQISALHTDAKDDDYIPSPTSSHSGWKSGSEKNSLPLPHSQRKGGGRKRNVGNDLEPENPHPLKRHPGIFSHAYVGILNSDISEAALRYTPPDPSHKTLKKSQFGLVVWTNDEKNHFFALLSRLGRDDIAGIAEELGSKSVLEVRQYVMLLEDAIEARRGGGSNFEDSGGGGEGGGMMGGPLRPVHVGEIPTAFEISDMGEQMLEGAADALAAIDQRYEEKLERRKWGRWWKITDAVAKELSGIALPQSEPTAARPKSSDDENQHYTKAAKIEKFARFFNLDMMLRLADRVFMNGGMNSDDNWRLVGNEKPSIRATAVEDFYDLTKSITKRLAVTALIMAEQRIRLRLRKDHNIKARVRRRDVRAALASLGMPRDSHRFWRDAARRLRLDVCEVQPRAGQQAEMMEYDAIEEELAVAEHTDEDDAFYDILGEDSGNDEDGSVIYDNAEDAPQRPFQTHDIHKSEAGANDPHTEGASSDGAVEDEELEPENVAIEEEVKEILKYSAFDYPADEPRAKIALYTRVKAERTREQAVEEQDMRYSHVEEAKLWQRVTGRNMPDGPVLGHIGEEEEKQLERRDGEGKECLERNEEQWAGLAGDEEKTTSKRSWRTAKQWEKSTTVAVEDFVHQMAGNWRHGFEYESEWEASLKN